MTSHQLQLILTLLSNIKSPKWNDAVNCFFEKLRMVDKGDEDECILADGLEFDVIIEDTESFDIQSLEVDLSNIQSQLQTNNENNNGSIFQTIRNVLRCIRYFSLIDRLSSHLKKSLNSLLQSTLLEVNTVTIYFDCLRKLQQPEIVPVWVQLVHYPDAVEPYLNLKGLLGNPNHDNLIYKYLVAMIAQEGLCLNIVLDAMKVLHQMFGKYSQISKLVVMVQYLNREMELFLNNNDSVNNKNQSVEDSSNDIITESTKDFVFFCITKLAWCIQMQSSLPLSVEKKENGEDLSKSSALLCQTDIIKLELAQEILRVLFVIGYKYFDNNSPYHNSNNHINEFEAMSLEMSTQLGLLICDILNKLNPKYSPNYNTILATITLLMEAPATFAEFLYVKGCLNTVLYILEMELGHVVIEGNSRAGSGLLPCFIVLTNLSENNLACHGFIKNRIFPVTSSCAEQKIDNDSSTNVDEEVEEEEESDKKKKKNKMAPEDAPKGTLRHSVITLMTSHDTNLKRCSSEFMWVLCNKDGGELIRRTGLGNAIHTLGMKGLMNLPNNRN